MKALFVAVFLTLSALTFSTMHKAQQSPFDFVVPASLPNIDFTPKEVIDILADYDIRHLEEIPGGQWWGITQPWNHRIFISNEGSMADRRHVVLHELVHAIYYNHGIETSGPANEAAVEAKALHLYHAIYDAPSQEVEPVVLIPSEPLSPSIDPTEGTVVEPK